MFLEYNMFQPIHCGQKEEPTVVISGLLLCMRHMYVASIHLDFH